MGYQSWLTPSFPLFLAPGGVSCPIGNRTRIDLRIALTMYQFKMIFQTSALFSVTMTEVHILTGAIMNEWYPPPLKLESC